MPQNGPKNGIRVTSLWAQRPLQAFMGSKSSSLHLLDSSVGVLK